MELILHVPLWLLPERILLPSVWTIYINEVSMKRSLCILGLDLALWRVLLLKTLWERVTNLWSAMHKHVNLTSAKMLPMVTNMMDYWFTKVSKFPENVTKSLALHNSLNEISDRFIIMVCALSLKQVVFLAKFAKHTVRLKNGLWIIRFIVVAIFCANILIFFYFLPGSQGKRL